MISDAFMSMGGDSHNDWRLEWSTIRTKLKSMGEGISDDELVHCLEVRGEGHFPFVTYSSAKGVINVQGHAPSRIIECY